MADEQINSTPPAPRAPVGTPQPAAPSAPDTGKVRAKEYKDPGPAARPKARAETIELVEGRTADRDVFIDEAGVVSTKQPERGWRVVTKGEQIQAHHLQYATPADR